MSVIGTSQNPSYNREYPRGGKRITDVSHKGGPMVGDVSPHGLYDNPELLPTSGKYGPGSASHVYSSLINPIATAIARERGGETPGWFQP